MVKDMKQLADLIEVMERIAPPAYAESWDNVGLIVGSRDQKLERVMLTIDYTPEVAAEVREANADAVLAYHPPIFDAIKRVTSDGSTELIFDAIRRGVAIYSPHTALDVAEGGTNDVLADAIAMTDRRPLKVRSSNACTHHKLVTFVPPEHFNLVSGALFSNGAGRIGAYDSCGFRTQGVGTFRGDPGTNPAVGRADRVESVDEVRFETIVPNANLERVVDALRRHHPYEEVAFDLIPLTPSPHPPVGIGRIGKLPGDATAEMLINMLKRAIGVDRLLVAGSTDRLVKRVAVCAGACGGDLLTEAIRQRADLYITGELRHHDALRATRAELTVVATLHSNSERVTLASLRDRLKSALPEVQFLLAGSDRDPFSIV